jgi:hypothetical protein
VVGFATGPGSIPWFFVTELFAQSGRPIATSIAVAVNWSANFLVGLGFSPIQVRLEQEYLLQRQHLCANPFDLRLRLLLLLNKIYF